MSHAVQVEIICDLCQERFVGTVENIPNTKGITKGTPLVAVRQQAEKVGWHRITLPNVGPAANGIQRRAMIIDCCPECGSGVESSLNNIRHMPLWFEDASV